MLTTASSKTAVGPVEYFRAKLEYEIAPGDLRRLLDASTNNVCVVDVREAGEFAAGHVPGARNVPLAELPSSFHSLPRDKMIVTCCRGLACGLSPRAALELAQKGFQVRHLIGGLEEWRSGGFPVEAAPPDAPSQAW